MTPAQWEMGRSPFPLLEDDNDYSGKDFDSTFLRESTSLSHAFLNGVSITNSVFLSCDLDQCEFGEAHLVRSTFLGCSLNGTDFVRASFFDSVFENCDFTDGEWRESAFVRIRFVGCKFSHTTVNLCSFLDCQFIEGSVDGLDYKAVNYNVFSKCEFDSGISNETVLSRNYGMKPTKASSSVVSFGSEATLEQICLLSSSRQVAAFDLVRAIEHESENFHGRMKTLRLEFIANIIRVVMSEGRLSPASIVYIEGILSRLGAAFLESGNPQAILSAFVTVRNALFERVNVILQEDQLVAGTIDRFELEYESRFSQREGEVFAAALDQVLAGGRGAVHLTSIEYGSTIFGIDVSDVICSVTTAVAAINLFLSQTQTLIKRSKAIKAELKKRKPAAKKEKNVARSKTVTPAQLFSGEEPEELVRLRRAVQQSGIELVPLDEFAKVTLHVRANGTTARAD